MAALLPPAILSPPPKPRCLPVLCLAASIAFLRL